MDWREEILKAVINSCNCFLKENGEALKAADKLNFTAYVKIVNREQKKRGDLSLSLQPLLRDVTSSAANFNRCYSLLTENPVTVEVVLKGIQYGLQESRCPVESLVLQNGIILLWLCKSAVLRRTILEAVAASDLSSFSASKHDGETVEKMALLHKPITDPALLYGATDVLSKEEISVYSSCSSQDQDCSKSGAEDSGGDISDFRAARVADHVSAIVRLCGGRLDRQCCNATLSQVGCQEEDSSCAPAAEGEQDDVARCRIDVVSSGRIRGAVGPVLAVAPVVDAQHKKKLRDWDAPRFSRLILSELEAASAHKQPIDGIGWHELLSQQSLSCLRMIMLATSPSSPLPLNIATPSANVRNVAFQLYNYSRLSTLLATYADLLRRKAVPPLPLPQNVNFELLKEPEEWELAWVYVHRWPSIMRSLAHHLKSCAAHTCPADGDASHAEGAAT